MTDIVERLRAMTWGAGLCEIEECLEAANEIEKLREGLEYIKDYSQFLTEAKAVARAALGEKE